MDNLKIHYRLYALELTVDNAKQAAEWRFSRVTIEPFPGYVLVYTDGVAPDGSIEITKSTVDRLSAQDEQWLRDCNIVILAEQAKKHEAELAASMGERLEALEKALKAKKSELEDKQTGV